MRYPGLAAATVFLMTLALSSSPSLADEVTVPLAASGDWVAFAHKPSALEAPDVCMAASATTHVGLRAQNDECELRLVNERWTLPSDVKGVVDVNVGKTDFKFDITGNTNDSIAATITEDQITTLLDAMGKASSMTVTAGKDKPIHTSLAGSNRVLSVRPRSC